MTSKNATLNVTIIILLLITMIFIQVHAQGSGHFFAAIDATIDNGDDYYIRGGGRSPDGGFIGLTQDVSTGSSYYAAIVVGDLNVDPPGIHVVALRPSSDSSAPSEVHVTSATFDNEGNLYVAGYALYPDITRYFIAKLVYSGTGGYYSLDQIRYFDSISTIYDLEMGDHPFYGSVLAVLAGYGNYFAVLILDPNNLSIITALEPRGWNTAGPDSGGVAIAPNGDIIVAGTLSSQGHIARIIWDSDSRTYTVNYIMPYLNGFHIYDVDVGTENDGNIYVYVAGAKEYSQYTDWGTGSDTDPVIVKINLAEFVPEKAPFQWVYIINDYAEGDDYMYSIDLHYDSEGYVDSIAYSGSLVIQVNGNNLQYPLVGALTPSGDTMVARVVPSPTESSYQYPRGFYKVVSVHGGLVYAMGQTWYATRENNDYYSTGLILFSPSISDTLAWEASPPSDWSDVVVNKAESAAELSVRNDIDPQVSDGTYTPAELSISTGELQGVTASDERPNWVYTASDSSPPQPIPEPWLTGLLVAVTLAAIAYRILHNKQKQL